MKITSESVRAYYESIGLEVETVDGFELVAAIDRDAERQKPKRAEKGSPEAKAKMKQLRSLRGKSKKENSDDQKEAN